MEAIREYLLSVTGAAMLSGIVSSLLGKNSYSGLIQLICGTFLIFTVTAPLIQPDFLSFPLPDSDIRKDAEDLVRQGVDYTSQAKARIIKEQLEAYIQDKASGLDARIVPEITLTEGETPVPDRVKLTGTWSAWAKDKLEDILERELGIPKERQVWMESKNG